MKLKKSYLIIAIIFFISLLCLPFKESLWGLNSKLMREQVLLTGQKVETINISDITPFKWDKIYSFGPYVPKEDIYRVIGYKWDNISETVNEGMNQLVFLKNGKVVCYLYGYPANNGYGISFDSVEYKGGTAIFDLKDNLNFRITKSGSVFYLKHIM